MKKWFCNFKINILILFTLFASSTALACQCASLPPVTKEVCDGYNIIFSGQVDSVSACDDKGLSIVHFTIDEVYKGTVMQNVRVEFDCASSCMMSFAKGDSWLMYTNFEKFDLLTVSLCSHTRKFFVEESQDIYALSAQQTFEEEKQFLGKTLGTQAFKEIVQPGDVTGRNEQPSGMNKLLLIAISIAAMAVIYFILKRKNGK